MIDYRTVKDSNSIVSNSVARTSQTTNCSNPFVIPIIKYVCIGGLGWIVARDIIVIIAMKKLKDNPIDIHLIMDRFAIVANLDMQ